MEPSSFRQRLDNLVNEVVGDLLSRVIIYVFVAIVAGVGFGGWALWRNVDDYVVALIGLGVFALTLFIINQFRSFFSRPRASIDSEPAFAASEVDRVFLKIREHCGVNWRPLFVGGSMIINGPFCPEDDTRLQYKSPLSDLDIMLRKMATPQQSPSPPFAPSAQEPFMLSPTGMLAGAEKDSEAKEEIRDLEGNDRSRGRDSGPYCDECGRFRHIPIPKTVDECRLDVLDAVRKEYGLS